MPELMKLSEVCAALKVSRNTLFRWRKQGFINFTKIGARNYISVAELNRFIASMP